MKGFDNISKEMTSLVVNSLTYLHPFQPPTQQIPGPTILSHLLPHHSNLPQIYLLLSASMLGQPCTGIPFNARFDMETLEEVFSVGNQRLMASYRVSAESACVLLAVARALLHKVRQGGREKERERLILSTFLCRMLLIVIFKRML